MYVRSSRGHEFDLIVRVKDIRTYGIRFKVALSMGLLNKIKRDGEHRQLLSLGGNQISVTSGMKPKALSF